MDKIFKGPDMVPENGKVTGPLSGTGMFYAEGPTGRVQMRDGHMCVGSTENQFVDEPGMYYPYEKIT